LKKGLAEKGPNWAILGKICAVFFAIMCIGGSFGGGNMFQINQAFQQFQGVTGGENSFIHGKGWLFGLIISVLVGIVIIGGIKRIAQWTDKIVPFMCGIYVLAALIIIFMNVSDVPAAFGAIFDGAFSSAAFAGGIVGTLIQGFRRAAFSNEAGIGSASIAHSAVKTNNPASEGIVSLLEPFIDTVVVCTMTALVLIITGYYQFDGKEGVELTSMAFEKGGLPFFKYILVVAVILFAFSTMIAWSYYGLQSWYYLVGVSKMKGNIYKMVFCGFVVIGAALELKPVIGFSDAMIFAMCFPNILGLVILMPKVKEELQKYLGKIRSGEIEQRK
jgi:AGCS family alanine or glycine:cation symporter